jgi:hypothetical protein
MLISTPEVCANRHAICIPRHFALRADLLQ